jgi:hypothetical protein
MPLDAASRSNGGGTKFLARVRVKYPRRFTPLDLVSDKFGAGHWAHLYGINN